MQFIGRVGVVNTVQDCGDVVVRYSNNKIFLLNQYALTKASLVGAFNISIGTAVNVDQEIKKFSSTTFPDED